MRTGRSDASVPTMPRLQYVGLVLVALVSFSGLILNFLEVSKDYALVQDDQYNLKSLREQIAAFKLALAVVTWTGLALVLFRVLLKTYKFMKKNGSRGHQRRLRIVSHTVEAHQINA